ncbi:MAG: hypothetical protein ACYCYI_05340 [Saccharofermentanales bacterium]
MKRFLKSALFVFVAILCLFSAMFPGGGGFGRFGFALEDVWSDWQSVGSPASTFWGNIGTWTADGIAYTGKGSGFPAIFSYTSLDTFGDASQAISSMTNYRVKMRIVKPASLDPYPRIIAGGKTSGAIGAVKPLQIDVRSYGIDIDQFGNTSWNNGNRGIAWNVLIPGGIAAGTAFDFEILITPSLIGIFINGISRYSVNPSLVRADADVGLFAVGAANTTAVKGVTFTAIEFATFGLPASAAEPGATVTSSAANNVRVSVSGLGAGDLFQVWILAQTPGDGTSPALSWFLAKAFLDVSAVGADASGNAVFDYAVPEAQWTGDGRYSLFVRVRGGSDGGSGAILMQQNLSISTIRGSVNIDRILVEGDEVKDIYYLPSDNTSKVLTIRAIASCDLESGDQVYYRFMRAGITQIGDTETPVDWFTLQNSASNTYSLTVPETGGIYMIRIKIYTLYDPAQNAQERVFKLVVNSAATPQAIITDPSIGNRDTMTAGDRFSINLDGKTGGNSNDPKYRFLVGEAWRTPFITQTYGSRSVFDEIISSPGIYLLQSYVSHKALTSFDDGILHFTTVRRPGSGPVTGEAFIASCDIDVNGSPVSLPSDSGGAAADADAYTLDVGDVVTFDVRGGGLAGDSVSDGNYRFSFWRLDINGHREVRSWSDDGTLTWRPFAPGNYSIVIRVKGSDAGSYEEQRSYRFVVSGISGMDGLSLDIDKNSAVSDDTADPAIAGRPVNITAVATGGSGDFVYRFEVWDAFLWTRVLQGFSADSSVVWIPRKAGVYNIIVRAQDVSSFGFGDRVVTSGEFRVR